MDAVVIGRFSQEQRSGVGAALERASMSARFLTEAGAARAALRERPPRLVLIDAAMGELEALLGWMRGDAALFGAVVIAIVPVANDRAFAEAHALGADDAVPLGDLGAITRRAAMLSHFDPATRPPMTQGRALVAHANIHRRLVLARTLRLAGFEVTFAAAADELDYPMDPPPALVVAAADLAAAAHASVNEADAPLVIVLGEGDAPPRLAGRVATIDESAPPDTLLFVANELLRPGVRDLRSSERRLYEALCSFRPAGSLSPVHGLTYNISRDGLYVRTLDPPERGASLWLELRPPGSNAAVHLRGRAVWVRTLDRSMAVAAPPGFGVQLELERCPPEDLAAYTTGYEAQGTD